jgi:hypothetical protein
MPATSGVARAKFLMNNGIRGEKTEGRAFDTGFQTVRDYKRESVLRLQNVPAAKERRRQYRELQELFDGPVWRARLDKSGTFQPLL